MKVLHVTESLGAGTETALRGFVRATPEIEHLLIYRERADSRSEPDFDEFACVSCVTSLAGLAIKTSEFVGRYGPSVIHLHSSWAGLIGRALPRFLLKVPRAYSPHCFYFERSDISPVVRQLARAAESRLAPRTDVLIAVSPHEAKLAAALGVSNVSLVSNALDSKPVTRERPLNSPPIVAAMGRVCPQKDPEFLIATAAECSALGLAVKWLWIGGGDHLLTRRLLDAGIHVTGWLERADARDLLESADLYIHTAAWEAAPVSIAEALSAGVPTVVRSLPTLVSLGHPDGLMSPRDLAERMLALRLASGGFQGQPPAKAASSGDESRATKSLEAAYASALSRRHRTEGVVTWAAK